MRKQPTQPSTLAMKLREAIAAIEGVELIDRSSYYTVKVNGRTVGYVNGRKRIRIDFPQRGGKRDQMPVERAAQIRTAVSRLRSFAPKDSANA
jgi:hypothetical protein